MRTGYIYKITNPNGKIYIGQTQSLESRIKHYKNSTCGKQPLIYKSLKKYGWDTHKFEIIYKTQNVEKLDKYEILFIKFYNSYYRTNKNYGLNLTIGGGNYKLKNHTEESKRKMSLSKIGKPSKLKGIPLKDDIKAKMRFTQAKRSIIDLETKKVYISIPLYADEFNINPHTIFKWLHNRNENKSKLRYVDTLDIVFNVSNRLELLQNIFENFCKIANNCIDLNFDTSNELQEITNMVFTLEICDNGKIGSTERDKYFKFGIPCKYDLYNRFLVLLNRFNNKFDIKEYNSYTVGILYNFFDQLSKLKIKIHKLKRK